VLKKFSKPIEVVWQNEDHDLPVVLTGFMKHTNNEFFFSIEGSSTCIPFEQIDFGGRDRLIEIIEIIKKS